MLMNLFSRGPGFAQGMPLTMEAGLEKRGNLLRFRSSWDSGFLSAPRTHWATSEEGLTETVARLNRFGLKNDKEKSEEDEPVVAPVASCARSAFPGRYLAVTLSCLMHHLTSQHQRLWKAWPVPGSFVTAVRVDCGVS